MLQSYLQPDPEGQAGGGSGGETVPPSGREYHTEAVERHHILPLAPPLQVSHRCSYSFNFTFFVHLYRNEKISHNE